MTTAAAAAAPERAACRFCERCVALNPLTGNLRHHLWPRGLATPSPWIVEGEACPGTGSAPGQR